MSILAGKQSVVMGLLGMAFGFFFFWISCGANAWNWFRARDWQPAPATVMRSYTRDASESPGLFIGIAFAYEIAGRPYEGTTYEFSNFAMEDGRAFQLIEGPLAPGRQIQIFYNPRRPEESVVDRSFDHRWLMGLMGLLWAAIGGAFLLQHRRDMRAPGRA